MKGPSRTLIVGAGALGGLLAARLRATGTPVWLATRDAESASRLLTSGLHVTGVGGAVSVRDVEIRPLETYAGDDTFDLVVLATKAHDATDAASRLSLMFGSGATLLPIQNGGVAEILAHRLGNCVLGGLSNLGATMTAPGIYEQRNAGHFLIGELGGGESERCARVREWLSQAVETRETSNIRGAVWSKLLVNCSVTTIGAIAGATMREYFRLPEGRIVFERTYDEALSVALASGAQPERMFADPIPPRRDGGGGQAYQAWLGTLLEAYGDVKPSMLQDFERGRRTEVDFINGYVVDLASTLGIATPMSTAIVQSVRAISEGSLRPGMALIGQLLRFAF